MVCVPSHEENVKPEQPKSQSVEPDPPQSDALMRAIAAVKSFTGEIELAELLKKLLLAMLEISPAQRGCLLLKTAEEWTVEAVAEKLGQHSQRVKILTGNQAPDLCRTMVELAIRHETTVLAHNASAEERFRADAYVQKHRPKSILCLVINHQQEMLCLVYLENNVRPDAFDHQTRELLDLLALQAGVSIKNAILCQELDNTVSELHKEIAKRKDTQLQLMRAGKLSALGRLSASLAHEFGNPLMGITYLLEDLSGRPAISEQDRHLISVGLEDCRRMRNLLDELHSLHNPSRKKRTLFRRR
jgi:GAF domain-containing protein